MISREDTVRLVTARGAFADVSLFGGQVLNWQTADGHACLFLSKLASYGTGTAIRGGIPVIFPQFADFGALPKHGFARTQRWHLVDRQDTADTVIAHLRTMDTHATTLIWPHAFTLGLTITLGNDTLGVELSACNTGATAFRFTAALHTYLGVQNIDDVSVTGLSGHTFTDTAAGGDSGVESTDALRINGEIDRIYDHIDAPVILREPGRETLIEAIGFPETVIWNPGAIRGASLIDLEPEGYRRMLCVEAAVVRTPVVLQPTQVWCGSQIISSRASVRRYSGLQ
jgi:glucose-6-phosphate 1-epimerase